MGCPGGPIRHVACEWVLSRIKGLGSLSRAVSLPLDAPELNAAENTRGYLKCDLHTNHTPVGALDLDRLAGRHTRVIANRQRLVGP